MALDYENEKWVRVYTRDTVTMKLLTWQARALLWELLRKADRAGVIDVGSDGAAGIAALVSMPLEITEVALPELLSRGVLRGGNGCFVFPNFIDAQEAKQSDAARQRRAREAKRARSLAQTTDEPAVTPRDGTVTKRDADVTKPVATVTPSHTVSLLDESRLDESRLEIICAADAPPTKPAPRRKPARPLPNDWVPSADHAAIAKERGVYMAGEVVQFRDWALGKGEIKADWDAAFRNWLRNARAHQGARTVSRGGGGMETALEIQRELEAKEAAEKQDFTEDWP